MVPRYPPPRFPHRCVVCGREHPTTTAQLLAQVPTGSRFVFDSYSVRVPCCRRHAIVLHATRLGRSVVLWTVYIGAIVAFAGRASSRAQAGAIGAAAFLLVILIRAAIKRSFRLGFDLEAASDSVTFSFRDLSLGYEFRALNPAAHEPGGLTGA